MRAAIAQVVSLIFLSLAGANEESDQIHYTNSWAVHVDEDDLDNVNELANKYGFTNLGQIGSLPGYFHFVKDSIKGRNKRSLDDDHTELLLAEPTVKWVKQQRVLERSKRNISPEHEYTERDKRDMAVTIQDPFFKDQWYLQNIGQSSGPPGLDINVLPAWGQGYSGKGIVVSILDDGVDHTHPDLKRNYDPDASFDFNDFDPDPKPRSKNPLNCHGTKCAGEVAAEANNGMCGVGVSFNASIGGIRMLDGKATDTVEGSSLSYHSNYIDIYTCCWGPKDDGKRFGKPGFLASKALQIGAERGRGGKGNIFVWATGNGGLTDDDCNCDGYTTSIYTISIGAISDHGLSTYYTETCASTLAVTFSGASHREAEENNIVTTGLDHKCTKTFKGTSSAAPLASGVLALVLEANPNLTWRDVQHIIVEASQKTSPLDEGWKKNGAGKEYNHKFGFGKLDAMRMIKKAKSWENVPKQRVCCSKEHDSPRNIPSSGNLIVSSNTSSCVGTTSEIRKLEHVQVKISLEHRHRGHLSVTLISPSETRSELLKTRRNDHSTQGLTDWVFMTVHFWGEDPRGTWTLIVTDNDRNTREHHVIKAKQGDFEDVTRVVMDDSEKQGPWDSNKINEYDKIKQAPPGNYSSQDHILKGMENTMGELVKGNKFTELAKRKKDRHHDAKGFVGSKPGHAQYKHKSSKHRTKKKNKHWTKKKTLKNYKTETKKHKDVENKENAKKTFRKMNSKKIHKYYKHKGHKKYKYTPNKQPKHRKDKGRVQGEGKSLMAEGSVEIPKGRTPLEAKIAIQAIMEPYFKVSTSRIVLPKRYRGFMGEVDIKMKLAKETNKERLAKDENENENHTIQLGSAKEISFPKFQGQQISVSKILKVPEVDTQNNEVNNVTHDLGMEPFRIPSKEVNVLEAARQNTEIQTARVGIPGQLQGDQNKTNNDDNIYINLLNSIKSMPHEGKAVDNSLEHFDERIDILTDAKPYSNDNSTSMLKNLTHDERRNSTTGSGFTRSNATGSTFNGSSYTGSNDNGSNDTKSKFEINSIGDGLSRGNLSERNTTGNHLEDDFKGETIYNTLSNVGIGNEAFRPEETPINFYDAVKDQFAEVRKLNASDLKTQAQKVTGNEIIGTGSNIAGNGSQGKAVEKGGEEVPDESSGFSGSSGVVIQEGTDCDDGNSFAIKCQSKGQASDGKMSHSTEELNDADDDDTGGIPQPQGTHDFQISSNSPTAKMQPLNDEDKLAYLLSTGKYPGSPEGTSKQVISQVTELRPFNTSDPKKQSVPERSNISMGPIQDKKSKSLQTSIKHQNVPVTLSLNEGLSQPEQKRPLNENVPDRPVEQNIGPTPSNQGIKIDISDLEPLDQFANKDFKALESALEKQVARLEKFRDDSPTGTRFLQRVKDDIRQRNVDDLKFIEDEIRKDMREAANERRSERKAFSDGDSFIEGSREYSDDYDDDDDDDSDRFHRLERRRLSKRAPKHELFHHHGQHSRDDNKYGKGNSGVLKSWTLILYGT